MAFAYTIEDRENMGDTWKVWGTFTNTGGGTGGDIKTGLKKVYYMKLQHTAAAVVADAPVCDETFPLSSGDVTIVTTADADGIWEAFGHY